MQLLRPIALYLLTASLAYTASAQTSAPAAASPVLLPKDPVAMMNLAWQMNGLHDPALKPWHLRASWQTLDENKQVKDQGTFEEWWAGENQYKFVYSSAAYQQTLYVTTHGAFLAGDMQPPALDFHDVIHLLMEPAPDEKSIMAGKWRAGHLREGTADLLCAEDQSVYRDTRYCFADDLPALRLFETIFENALFNSVVSFQGHYPARAIRAVRRSEPELMIAIDQIESLATVNASDFTPPAAAIPVGDHPLVIDCGVLKRVRGGEPQYPPNAKAARIAGIVAIESTVETDGSQSDLKIVSGPQELQKAALDAVKTWRFQPCLLGGEPVALRTQTAITFSLGY